MNVGLRIYRDGPPLIAAARRIETVFLPRLERMPGFCGAAMIRFCQPFNGAAGALGLIAFRDGGQLTAAEQEASEWSRVHLADLQAAIRPTEMFPAEVLFSRGQLC